MRLFLLSILRGDVEASFTSWACYGFAFVVRRDFEVQTAGAG